MLAQRDSDHVLAARSLGVKPGAIVFRHMLPNALGPVIVQATLVLASAIIDAAALSFLGLGNPDDRRPEWGQMLASATAYFNDFPHLAIYPGALHHRRRPRLHADGRVAARGTRPEGEEVTPWRPHRPTASRCCRSRTCRSPSPRHGEEAVQRRRRRQLRRPRRRDPRPGRRVRLRQVGDLAGDHGAAAQARQPGRGHRDVRRHRPARRSPASAMRDIRGRDIAMIFQDPLSSLNPVVPIGIQVTEVMERHRGLSPQGGDAAGARPAGAGRHPRPRGPAARTTPTSCPAACGSGR